MPALVIDASLAAAWSFPDEQTEYTNGVLRIVGESVDPIAPSLWTYEIQNAILMGRKRGRLTAEAAQRVLTFLKGLDVQLYEPSSFDSLFALAELHSLTVYDAAYLDLALRVGAPLASLDGALRKAASKAGVVLFEIPQGR